MDIIREDDDDIIDLIADDDDEFAEAVTNNSFCTMVVRISIVQPWWYQYKNGLKEVTRRRRSINDNTH